MMDEKLKRILRLDIKQPIDYWLKYWDYAVDELGNKDSCKILLRTPRIIIEDLLEEISNEKIWIKENIDLFRSELGSWIENDKAFNASFKSEITLLCSSLDGCNNQPLQRQLCKSILRDMDNGKYFEALINQMVHIVNISTPITYELKYEINDITVSLITELLYRGYSLQNLKGMSAEVPNVQFAIGLNVIAAPSKCLGLNREDFVDNDCYYEALTYKINNRTPEEVVIGLKNFYNKKSLERIVLFRINGLKGEVDQMIGDINFYCPRKKQYIRDDNRLNTIEDTSAAYVNAAVPVRAISSDTIVELAKEKLLHAIQILNLLEQPNKSITIAKEEMTTISKDGKISGNLCLDLVSDVNEQIKKDHLSGADMEYFERTKEISEKYKLLQNNSSPLSKLLLSSLHWLNKCESCDRQEDQLLFAWIALENLTDLKKSTLVCLCKCEKPNTRETLKTIVALVMSIHDDFWQKRLLFRTLYDGLHYYENYYGISDELACKADLNKKPGEKCNMNRFIHHLSELEREVNDEIICTWIHEVDKYHKNKVKSLKGTYHYYENIITLLYRIRNLEVHHAKFSNIIRYYVPFLMHICKQIVYFVLDEYEQTGDSLDDIFIREKIRYEKLESRN